METNKAKKPIVTNISFRIFAPGLIPEEITRELEIKPDYFHHEGDYPGNNPKHSPYKHGMWSLKSKLSEEESLAAHLDNVLSILDPKSSYISQLAQRTTVDFYCVLYSQSGFQLSPQLLKRISELGATFGVVLYE